MYKKYCDESLVDFKLPRHKFREEMKNYFEKFHDITRIDGKQVRSYYTGFLVEKFTSISDKTSKDDKAYSLVLDKDDSILDEIFSNRPAQYASSNDTPTKKWDEVTTKLSDINTKEVHYVKLPLEHIVIDFDIKDENGLKSMEKNIEAASKWPSTYAEFSKSGKGIHLHYIYSGDVNNLSRVYDDDIEVKVFIGNSSLRRKFTKCNNIPIATINSGLPLKGEKVLNFDSVKSEKALRTLIKRNLNKEIHPATKTSVDFIYKILEDAYNSGLVYDITDMRPEILNFASNSSNQAHYCIKLVAKMRFQSEKENPANQEYKENELIFYDVEVFPNLFIVVWKAAGKKPVKMINPTAAALEPLLGFKLVGYNCRRYDNHILYARYIGYTLEQLYTLSQRIISGSANSMFREAYNLSYTDIYDFSSKKQSLKKFQLELGIHHQEIGLKWTDPVPEELWDKVADYCVNDVIATEAVFEARKQDFAARLILSELSGLSPNDTTQQHTAKIIFGDDPKPQSQFVYTDLSELFPGYKFERGVSTYRGESPGEGGHVYSEPGYYKNVGLFDIISMHPVSLKELNLFGKYTKKYVELMEARIAIKKKDFTKAKNMFNGLLEKYLQNEEQAADLAYALKIVINIVYGLTSASFDSKFKDPRNVDNIVAKRGALFMIDLKKAVQEQGYQVVHIKTDSIKIPNADDKITNFIKNFGKKYGYEFEHEETYEKLCLVNDAVYIAKTRQGEWTATGAQFAHPFVFKSLFSHEPIEFEDLCEIKSVTTALYLDMNEGLPENEHNYTFIGKVGEFCPIKPGAGGGILLREKDEKFHAATGTKGFRWLESVLVKELEKEKDIDRTYFSKLVDDAVENISQYCDFEELIS
jgi:hypothetical protein